MALDRIDALLAKAKAFTEGATNRWRVIYPAFQPKDNPFTADDFTGDTEPFAQEWADYMAAALNVAPALLAVARAAAEVGLGIADRDSEAFNAALQRMAVALTALAKLEDA